MRNKGRREASSNISFNSNWRSSTANYVYIGLIDKSAELRSNIFCRKKEFMIFRSNRICERTADAPIAEYI